MLRSCSSKSVTCQSLSHERPGSATIDGRIDIPGKLLRGSRESRAFLPAGMTACICGSPADSAPIGIAAISGNGPRIHNQIFNYSPQGQ